MNASRNAHFAQVGEGPRNGAKMSRDRGRYGSDRIFWREVGTVRWRYSVNLMWWSYTDESEAVGG